MLTVLLAVAAAVFVGVACASQDRATHEVSTYPTLHPGLILALARRPWWLLGTAASVAGLGLQIGALATGSIIVVQCLMASSLGWTALTQWLLTRRRPTMRAAGGIVLAGTGLIALLILLAPTQNLGAAATPTPAAAVAIGAVAAAGAGAGLAWARWGPRHTRGLGLAVVTGTGYGLTAALLKLVTAQLQLGWTEPLTHPAFWVACVVGPASILLSQNTFQQGRLVTPAVTIILILDPVLGLATGVSWFGEHITAEPIALLGALAAAAAAVAGVALLHTSRLPSATPAVGNRLSGAGAR